MPLFIVVKIPEFEIAGVVTQRRTQQSLLTGAAECSRNRGILKFKLAKQDGECTITMGMTVNTLKQITAILAPLDIGTPAITRRGCGDEEAAQVANWICDVLDNIEDEANIASVKEQVMALCKRFPVYA